MQSTCVNKIPGKDDGVAMEFSAEEWGGGWS